MHSVRRIEERPGTTLHLSAASAKAANDRGVSERRLKLPPFAPPTPRFLSLPQFDKLWILPFLWSACRDEFVSFCRFVYRWRTGFTMQIWMKPSSLRPNASHSLPLARRLMTSLISYEKRSTTDAGGCCRLTVTIQHERVQDRLSEGHGELPSVSRS